jgi:hypothetical protein
MWTEKIAGCGYIHMRMHANKAADVFGCTHGGMPT